MSYLYGWAYGAVADYAAAAQAMQDEEVPNITITSSKGDVPGMAEFFNNPLLSDINICSEDGQTFHCHKLVLIRWSEPLRSMLTGGMLEARQRSITLHGVDNDVLAAFLRFLYTCSTSIPTEKLVELTAVADQYDVTLLQQRCMEAIRRYAPNHRCCCLFYKAAKEVQQAEIQQLAWEHMSSNLNTLVRQHAVFVQLELEDVLMLCGKHNMASQQAAATAAAGCSSSNGSDPTDINGDLTSVATQPTWQGTPSAAASQPHYLMFLALMAWLDHKPERQQCRQQVLQCVNFDGMNNYELSQVRHDPHVQADGDLKEMLLDAYARRCEATSQQPVYRMLPMTPL